MPIQTEVLLESIAMARQVMGGEVLPPAAEARLIIALYELRLSGIAVAARAAPKSSPKAPRRATEPAPAAPASAASAATCKTEGCSHPVRVRASGLCMRCYKREWERRRVATTKSATK